MVMPIYMYCPGVLPLTMHIYVYCPEVLPSVNIHVYNYPGVCPLPALPSAYRSAQPSPGGCRCTKHKLRNVGCARIVLDFSQVVPRIVDASAVFGAAFDIGESDAL